MTYEEWARLDFVAKRLSSEQMRALETIAVAMPKFGPRALALLVETAEGLVVGAPYGDWAPSDGRDRPREARAEAKDGRLYVTDELGRARARVAALESAQRAFTAAHDALQLADTYPPPAEPMLAGG
jgi:hypothetical protein